MKLFLAMWFGMALLVGSFACNAQSDELTQERADRLIARELELLREEVKLLRKEVDLVKIENEMLKRLTINQQSGTVDPKTAMAPSPQQNKRLESLLAERREARTQVHRWEREVARNRQMEDSEGKIALLGNAEIMLQMCKGDLAAAETELRQFQEGVESGESSQVPAANVSPGYENLYCPGPLNFDFTNTSSQTAPTLQTAPNLYCPGPLNLLNSRPESTLNFDFTK